MPSGEQMNKNYIVALIIMLTISTAQIVSAEQNSEKITAAFNNLFREAQTAALSIMATMESAGIVKSAVETMPSATVIEQKRVRTVGNGIGEYASKIQIGDDPHGILSVTYYMPEAGEWQSTADEALVVLNGESLTGNTITDLPTNESLAINLAEQGINVFIAGRTTDYARQGEDLSFMKDISPESQAYAVYITILYAKMQTSSLHAGFPIPMGNINTTLLGYSMGALEAVSYLAGPYPYNSKSYRGDIRNFISIEMAIKFSPEEKELIENQAKRYYYLRQKIDSGIFYNDEMLSMLYLANLAKTDPDGLTDPNKPNSKTNMELWRELMSKTYKFDPFPYTENFHYISGNKNRLYKGVDEQRVLSASLTGAPYAPLSMDLFAAGVMGNISGYDIDAGKITTRTLCIGLDGGFGNQSCYWFNAEVSKTADVTSIEWGHGGHASWLFDENAKQLWRQIAIWNQE